MQRTAITFDIDWAPDWTIELCAGLCKDAGVPATFFATHASAATERLLGDPDFEVGIHPNFSPGSSHGADQRAVMKHMLGLVSRARSMRTHSLIQSSGIYALVCDEFEQIQTDVSLLLPLHQGLAPTVIHMGESGRELVRLPYFWEDDVVACRPEWNWGFDASGFGDGLKIFDFHPIHVALNMRSMEDYRRLKAAVGTRALASVTREELRPYEQKREGARTYLESLLKHVRIAGGARTIDGITSEWRTGK